MTDERLAELRALSEKAPPSPWKFIEEEDRIYASRIAVPELLDEIERLRECLSNIDGGYYAGLATQSDSAGSTVPQENEAAGGSHKT